MRRNPCPVCGKTIIGRSDKKFCSQSCKNKFHHPSKSVHANEIKLINRYLYQNFKILQQLYQSDSKTKVQIPKIVLEKMGFHFDYCTGCYINSQKKLYRYVYHYGWMEFSSQSVLIIKTQNKTKK